MKDPTLKSELQYLDNLMQALANAKNVPIGKVIRNAAKDISATAYKFTPRAQVTKTSFWHIKNQKGEMIWVNRANIPERKTNRRTKKHKRIKIWRKVRKGYAAASWVRIMQNLGMEKKSSPYRKAMEQGMTVDETSKSFQTPFVRILNALDYIKKLDDRAGMIDKGIQNASEKLLRGLDQMMASKLRRENRSIE